MAKDRLDIHPNQNPTVRVSPAWQDCQARKFSVASSVFAVSTLAFFVLFTLSAITGIEAIFTVGIGIVFVIWLPCLIVSACTAKYYDPWGVDKILRHSR